MTFAAICGRILDQLSALQCLQVGNPLELRLNARGERLLNYLRQRKAR